MKLIIHGFHCESCVRLSTLRLKKLPGVQRAEVQPDGHAELIASRDIPLQEIQQAFSDTEYTVEADSNN